MIQKGTMMAGLAADDGAAVHFVDEKINQAVSSRPTAKVYRVSWLNGQVVEESLDTHYMRGS